MGWEFNKEIKKAIPEKALKMGFPIVVRGMNLKKLLESSISMPDLVQN